MSGDAGPPRPERARPVRGRLVPGRLVVPGGRERGRRPTPRGRAVLLLGAGLAGLAAVLGTAAASQHGWLASFGLGGAAYSSSPASTAPDARSAAGVTTPPSGAGRSAQDHSTPPLAGRSPGQRARRLPVPHRASGRLVMVPGRVLASGPGRRLVYRVEIEAGLPFEPAEVAGTVHRVLVDPRGWEPLENVAFERTDGTRAEIYLVLASPALTDALCLPLDTAGQLSCRNGNRVVLNALRWASGVPGYHGRLEDYRSYLVNHEVGHALRHHHALCRQPGGPAPVMMQQSKGLGRCLPNPWPSIRAD